MENKEPSEILLKAKIKYTPELKLVLTDMWFYMLYSKKRNLIRLNTARLTIWAPAVFITTNPSLYYDMHIKYHRNTNLYKLSIKLPILIYNKVHSI